jgi:hypothetical protein
VAAGYGSQVPDTEADIIRRLRAAGAAVPAALDAYHRAIEERAQAIREAHFDGGLRPYVIAKAVQVSGATVHFALRDERERRAAAARKAADKE